MLHYLKPGNIILLWLLSLCNSVETKLEWDKSNALLTEFLYETATTKVIGSACRNAVINL